MSEKGIPHVVGLGVDWANLEASGDILWWDEAIDLPATTSFHPIPYYEAI